MFNNFAMSDEDIIEIIQTYNNLIKKASIINGVYIEDLEQEIVIEIYKKLTI